MVGTEKQVRWAEQIRERTLASIDVAAEGLIAKANREHPNFAAFESVIRAATKSLVARLLDINSASTWIDKFKFFDASLELRNEAKKLRDA